MLHVNGALQVGDLLLSETTAGLVEQALRSGPGRAVRFVSSVTIATSVYAIDTGRGDESDFGQVGPQRIDQLCALANE